MICEHCNAPLVTVRAIFGEPWQQCPFEDCPGHGREAEPCWGQMRCYDEWGEEDRVCMLACNGHISNASSLTLSDSDSEPYEPNPRSL